MSRLVKGLIAFMVVLVIMMVVFTLVAAPTPAKKTQPVSSAPLVGVAPSGVAPSGVTPTTVAPSSPVAAAGGAVRSDLHCGPKFGGAKCAPNQCCSIYGWCSQSPSDQHCTKQLNDPAYNGEGAVVR